MAKVSAVVLCLAAALAAAAAALCGHSLCPENFVLVGGRCLNVSTATYHGQSPALQWPEARELCRAMSSGGWAADLASVDLPLLASFTDFILMHIPGMKYYIFWAGAQKVDGRWEALDGTLIDPMDYMWHMTYPTPADADDRIYGMLVPASVNQLRFYLTPYSNHSVGPSALCEARLPA
ncbi:uncharacterized protein LOC122266345 [Penaeus japonicus]|uniref:uncharacterized protein LOC122266345 n=1 Tax=Penaeus japonicus TaxID=27405 RepID=UPI001C70FAB1|nr:uncharacterized protein LOC122266345 [Penaeus japonicus]